MRPLIEIVVIPASMGPRLFSHGDGFIDNYVGHNFQSLQWGHGCLAMETWSVLVHLPFNTIASMGPRLFSHGDNFSSISIHPGGLRLQWGHGCLAMETLIPPIMLHFNSLRFNGATAV